MSRHDDHPGETRIHVGNFNPGDIALFKDIADASAKSTARELFIQMGLDPAQPLVSQRYFQTLRELSERAEENTADAAWVRRWRPRTEGLLGRVAAVILTLSLAGAWTALVTNVRMIMAQGPTGPTAPHP